MVKAVLRRLGLSPLSLALVLEMMNRVRLRRRF
jgi:hypothetical protein